MQGEGLCMAPAAAKLGRGQAKAPSVLVQRGHHGDSGPFPSPRASCAGSQHRRAMPMPVAPRFWLRLRGASPSPPFALPFAEEEQGAAPGSTFEERDPSQPMEQDGATSVQMLSIAPRVGAEGPTDAPSVLGAAEGDPEPPEGFPLPPSPMHRPEHPRDAVGSSAHAASTGAPGHRGPAPTSAASATSTERGEHGGTPPGGVSTPGPAAEDAELSGDVVESPRTSPLPAAPVRPQEEGEEPSGALWLPSPVAPGDGGTVPAAEVTVVTPWHAEVPDGGSSTTVMGGEEAAPGTDHGTPAASSEEEEEEEEDEEQPAPSAATVEGFLAAVPGEPGGTRRDGLSSPHTASFGVIPVGTPLGDPAPSTTVPLPALPTERASVGAGAAGPQGTTLALGAALVAALWP